MQRGQIMVIGLVAMILTVLVGTAPAQLRGRGQGFRVCPYTSYKCPTPSQDVCRPLDITGKITGLLTESPQPGMHPGMAFFMQTKDKGRVRVSLGPVWFLERQEVFFKIGDKVKVKGVCFDSGGETKLVAAEVVKGDNVLVLRDSMGRPLWEAWRKR